MFIGRTFGYRVLGIPAIALVFGMLGISSEALGKSKYIPPQDRNGPTDLVVNEGDGRKVDIEAECRREMQVATATYKKDVKLDLICRAKRDNKIKIQNPEGEELDRIQKMCPAPVRMAPLCEMCAEHSACGLRLARVKAWHACRYKEIAEGEVANSDSSVIDKEITTWCGPQLKVETAYILMPDGASLMATRAPQLRPYVKPAAPAATRVPQASVQSKPKKK